jgi:hypothetical protein
MTNRQNFVQLGRKYSLSMATEIDISIEGHQSAICQVFGHNMLGTMSLLVGYMGSDNLSSLEFAASFSSFTCAWLPSLSPHMSRTHHNHKHNELLSSHVVCASHWQKLIS